MSFNPNASKGNVYTTCKMCTDCLDCIRCKDCIFYAECCSCEDNCQLKTCLCVPIGVVVAIFLAMFVDMARNPTDYEKYR